MKQYPDSSNIEVIGKYINEGDARLSASIAKEYNPAISYAVGALAMHENVLYECIQATTGEFDRFCWRVTSAQEQLKKVDAKVDTELVTKQDMLISGTNIKSINNASILGAGNMNIDAISVLTVAPTAANTGLPKIVHLSSEPATRYDGYIYLIDEE